MPLDTACGLLRLVVASRVVNMAACSGAPISNATC